MPTLPPEDDDDNEDGHEDAEYNDNSDTESCCSDASAIELPKWEPLEIDKMIP